ncbi:general secretion pathway protein J [Desulfuromusa kysingii]|uniref:Type II secretion system protein J n=1 Tax=Desulfuromusa kysingii TaxID=37625 RepID=A0A1H3W4X3_9BACT|nr:type II secretion system protein GspJ [Desulfuromusa kysingii]SDZ81392.1 general secretion pathway protein J [Desulfuromusa kysingii]
MKSVTRGFTLVEVLVAIFIGSLVLTSVYGVFGSVSKARNRLELEGELYHQARIFFDRIGGELGSLRISPLGTEAVLSSGLTAAGDFYLEFNTELVSPLLQKYGGISRVRYEVLQQEESFQLLRSEKVLLVDMAASEPLLFIAAVNSFQVRFYSRGDWSESWSNSTPPQLVEISLELQADGQVIPFRSSFVLSGGR